MEIIFKKSVMGRRGFYLPQLDVPPYLNMPKNYLRKEDANLCELSELDVIRHFTALSKMNVGVDTCFYPLGSCTMKYNPKILEKISQLDGFINVHPLLPQFGGGIFFSQGCLCILYELEKLLCEITGMDAFTLQPMAGANGELTGMLIVAAYHKYKKNKKTEVLIPDEAHGTNPASAAIAGFNVKAVPTNPDTGVIDIETIQSMIGPQTAAIMMTNPNTLGIFNSDIDKIAKYAHKYDTLLYYDGANLNAVLGKFRPGDADFDIVHINLHKTFGTPHGGGGPGAGPIGVKKYLEPFLPIPRINKTHEGIFQLDYNHKDSIGHIASFYGNFLVCLKAYAYILLNGSDGLKKVSENAVLNANYIMNSLKKYYDVPYSRKCMHECVISANKLKSIGISALDIAKRLIDMGFHPPTVYFPLIVKESIMIEPTETESKETLDNFIDAMKKILEEAKNNPAILHEAPVNTCIGRVDEVKAVKEMDFCFYDKN